MQVKVNDIHKALCEIAPLNFALETDNVGLLVGDMNAPVSKVLVALDVTKHVLREAAEAGAGLVVSHHPMPRYKLDRITSETLDGEKVLYAIQNGIAIISMHTNLDAAAGGVNDQLAKAVGLTNVGRFDYKGSVGSVPPCGRVGYVDPCTVKEYLPRVAAGLGTDKLRYVVGSGRVHKVAVGSGNCSDYWTDALELGCDTYISGDFKYGQLAAAAEMGLNIIDGGHFPTENVVCAPVCESLRASFPALTVFVSKTHRDCVNFYRGAK